MSKLQYNSQTNKLGEYDWCGTRKLEHNQILDSSEVVKGTQIKPTISEWETVDSESDLEYFKSLGLETRTVYLDAKPEAEPERGYKITSLSVEPEAVREEEKAIDFAVWYSGMNPEKVERAYQRYLSEIKLNQQ